jgi:hypothetical protein
MINSVAASSTGHSDAATRPRRIWRLSPKPLVFACGPEPVEGLSWFYQSMGCSAGLQPSICPRSAEFERGVCRPEGRRYGVDQSITQARAQGLRHLRLNI